MSEETLERLGKLRLPFPDHQISKLPKPTKAQTDAVRADFKKGIRCQVCGTWHHPDVIHLDYVGHAAATDRLLDTDIGWAWSPVAIDQRGLPAFDENGGLWIKLTVCGVTRLGYGNAAGKPNQDPGNREKEVIGDAIRNAGMRFGMALDLWHKGDLHVDDSTVEETAPVDEIKPRQKLDGKYTSKTALWAAVKLFDREVRSCGDIDQFEALMNDKGTKDLLMQVMRDAGNVWSGGEGLPAEFVPLEMLIQQTRDGFNTDLNVEEIGY